MALFGKKKAEDEVIVEETAVTPTESTEQVADERVEQLEKELKELKEFKVKTEKLNQLQAKSEELGFQGDLEQIYDDDLSVAYANLISAYAEEIKNRKEEFIENSGVEDEGDMGSELDDLDPANRTEAINMIKAQFNVKGKDAVEQAKKLFPNLWR